MSREPSAPAARQAARIWQAALDIAVLLLFTLFAIASWERFLTSRSIQAFGILAVNTLFLGLFLTRRRDAAESPSLPLWLLGIAGTAFPLLLRLATGPV